VPGADQYRASDFIESIKGSGGIITTIARRVGCNWHTAKKYILKHPTVMAAYEDECAKNLDVAESVIVRNIQIVAKEQSDKKRAVDSADSKWYLAMKGSGRGYAQTQKQVVSGPDDGPVEIVSDEKRLDKILALLAIAEARRGEDEGAVEDE